MNTVWLDGHSVQATSLLKRSKSCNHAALRQRHFMRDCTNCVGHRHTCTTTHTAAYFNRKGRNSSAALQYRCYNNMRSCGSDLCTLSSKLSVTNAVSAQERWLCQINNERTLYSSVSCYDGVPKNIRNASSMARGPSTQRFMITTYARKT